MGQECLPVCVNLPQSHKGTFSVISQQHIFNASRRQGFNDHFYVPLNLLHYASTQRREVLTRLD